ncbi:MAG: Crp/Fnr family transcriptional regulator [Bacillota bacterium]|nr:Crp/Fnr family transcriptional regulator [Bacillota bacterium]
MKPSKEILEKYNIHDYFTTLDIPMELKTYQKGDLLVSPQFPSENMIILLYGTIHIYGIHEDGSYYSVTIHEKCKVVGDIEFVNGKHPSDFVEADSEILAIEIPMPYCRNVLSNDVKFLNLLLKSLVSKMEKNFYQEKYINLEDKVLRYLQSECENGILTDVGIVANKLHISRRQFQRILKKFCDQGTIEKLQKGRYQLKK